MAGTLSKRLSTRAKRYVHREFARSITESCALAAAAVIAQHSPAVRAFVVVLWGA
jgi:hypothetical protein